jgi:hypothetical protein
MTAVGHWGKGFASCPVDLERMMNLPDNSEKGGGATPALMNTFPSTGSLSNGTVLTSGKPYGVRIPLWAGMPAITSIMFLSSSQVLSGMTSLWFALHDPAGTLLRKTVETTAGTWAVSTQKQLALTSSFQPTLTGPHILVCVAVASTTPSLSTQNDSATLAGYPPYKAFTTADSGLTYATHPATLGAQTANAARAYAEVR